MSVCGIRIVRFCLGRDMCVCACRCGIGGLCWLVLGVVGTGSGTGFVGRFAGIRG